jgi:PAT family beta-lactamase induction signal transducer AmpG
MKINSIKSFIQPIFIKILALGFASGLPRALTASTLAAYLQDYGISLSAIGLFSLVAIPYSIKFFWSPLLDQFSAPFIFKKLGHRKGWISLINLLIVLTIFSMGAINPADNIYTLALSALLLAFLSASLDIVIDAFRIELLSDEDQGTGAAAAVFGYRLGMLASGAGALYIAHFYDWKLCFEVMSYLMIIGIIATMLCREKPHKKPIIFHSLSSWSKNAFISPLLDFIKRPHAADILLLIVFYKMSDAFAGTLTTPFLMNIGFNKQEIATIVKVYGFAATVIGFFIGGQFIKSLGYNRALFWGVILQMISNLVFVIQANAGHDELVLTLAISVENMASGISSAALVAYISTLCNKSFTATQYALFSALAVTASTVLSSPAGYVAEYTGWITFFVISSILSLPSIYFLNNISKKGA